MNVEVRGRNGHLLPALCTPSLELESSDHGTKFRSLLVQIMANSFWTMLLKGKWARW
jgi:hypothetical protein